MYVEDDGQKESLTEHGIIFFLNGIFYILNFGSAFLYETCDGNKNGS